ncbi:MAG: hypothetical protein KUL85_10970 [Sphingobacterium mizutaii]|nr:hypothetical protein [Sphingobacterium mizutaii]
MSNLIKISSCFLLLVFMVQACQNQGKKQQNTPPEFQFKEKLSDYGFFKGKLSELNPNPELISYDLSSALFSDYAIKDRFIVLPEGSKMKYVDNEELEFPDSTIIIKNFAYRNSDDEKIMIETRLLVKDPPTIIGR